MVVSSGLPARALFQQLIKSVYAPIALFSKTFGDTEKRDSMLGQMRLAAYLATKHLRHFAKGRSF